MVLYLDHRDCSYRSLIQTSRKPAFDQHHPKDFFFLAKQIICERRSLFKKWALIWAPLVILISVLTKWMLPSFCERKQTLRKSYARAKLSTAQWLKMSAEVSVGLSFHKLAHKFSDAFSSGALPNAMNKLRALSWAPLNYWKWALSWS